MTTIADADTQQRGSESFDSLPRLIAGTGNAPLPFGIGSVKSRISGP